MSINKRTLPADGDQRPEAAFAGPGASGPKPVPSTASNGTMPVKPALEQLEARGWKVHRPSGRGFILPAGKAADDNDEGGAA